MNEMKTANETKKESKYKQIVDIFVNRDTDDVKK